MSDKDPLAEWQALSQEIRSAGLAVATSTSGYVRNRGETGSTLSTVRARLLQYSALQSQAWDQSEIQVETQRVRLEGGEVLKAKGNHR